MNETYLSEKQLQEIAARLNSKATLKNGKIATIDLRYLIKIAHKKGEK